LEWVQTLRSFVNAVQLGSLSSAGRMLGRSPASVSRHITSLEDQLGTPLLKRSSRNIALTEAGELYYNQVEQILQQLSEANRSITQLHTKPQGILRVHSRMLVGQLMILPNLPRFLDKYPDITVDLVMSNNIAPVMEQGIDVDIRIGRLEDSSLIARKICDMQHSAVASPEYLLAHSEPKTPEDLRHHACIVDTNLQGQANWRFVDKGQTLSVHVSGPVRVNSPLSARDAALAGLGLALLPGYLADPLIASGKLVRVLSDYMQTGSRLQAVYPHRRHLAGKVRALIDHLVAWFEAHPI